MTAADIMTACETVAAKIASLVTGTRQLRNLGSTLIITGQARHIEVVVLAGSVGILASNNSICETLPAGLTYREIAAHITRVANEDRVRHIGDAIVASGSGWIHRPAVAV